MMTHGGDGSSTANIKFLNVLGRFFVYNENMVRHAELDNKTWHRLGRLLRKGKSIPAEIKTAPELASVFEKPCENPGTTDDPGLRNLILQVSQACNLRCRYCGADFGRYGGDFKMMSSATAERAIDLLFDTSPSSELAITYFGGEPLLNLLTVIASARHALQRAKKEGRNLSLHLVTNGVLLKPETLFRLDELGFSLTVSIDGPKGCHDLLRPSHDGSGSYRTITRSLEIARKLPIGQRITVRGTFTRQTAAFFPNVRFLAEKGFSRNIAYEPVFLPLSHPLSLRWQDMQTVKQAYSDLARYYVKQWMRGEPFCLWDIDDAITQLVKATPRKSRCGSGVTTVAVTADEDIFACHMSTGMADACLGDLQRGLDEKRCMPWRERYLQGRTGCSGCWVRALCGGGCNTHALLYNKSLCHPYRLECELIEHRYRLALWILAEIPGLKEKISDRLTAGANDSGHLLSPLWSYPDRPAEDGQKSEQMY